MTASPRCPVVAGTAAAALLLVAAPSPADALRALRDAGAALDATAPLVALIALAAWLLAGWLVLTVLVTAGGHLPGLAGWLLRAVARHVAPAAVRRAVEVALGLTVAVGVLGASPAAAAPGTESRPAPATASLDPAAAAPVADGGRGLDWPAAPAGPDPTSPTGDAAPTQPLDWPGVQRPAEPAPAPDASPAAETVVVRPGDTLWGLAEQDLQSHGAAAPTDAQVARAWPAWWAANRDAVGDDPDLLHPGTPLVPPPADGATPPAS